MRISSFYFLRDEASLESLIGLYSNALWEKCPPNPIWSSLLSLWHFGKSFQVLNLIRETSKICEKLAGNIEKYGSGFIENVEASHFYVTSRTFGIGALRKNILQQILRYVFKFIRFHITRHEHIPSRFNPQKIPTLILTGLE